MEVIQHWVVQYGYLGIFSLLVLGIVGLPVPDETLLAFAGYLIRRGDLKAFPVWLAALLGSMCGITISYILGRTTGYYLIRKYGPRMHFPPERLDLVHHWFRRLGGFTLTFGYFVPGVRHFTAAVAGASRLEVHVFAAFAYGGAVLWTSCFITLGYFLGELWPQGLGSVHRLALVAGCLAAAVIFGYLLYRRRRTR
jgi:membrane protein DedA with SNARE-associated domain